MRHVLQNLLSANTNPQAHGLFVLDDLVGPLEEILEWVGSHLGILEIESYSSIPIRFGPEPRVPC